MWQFNNELYHYGILGMKWGVRRYQNPDGSLTSAGQRRYRRAEKKTARKVAKVQTKAIKKAYSKDAKKVSEINAKPMNQMSNQDLRIATERSNLERNYKKVNPNTLKKGLALTSTIVGSMGTIIALYDNSNKIMKIGKKLVKKITKK